MTSVQLIEELKKVILDPEVLLKVLKVLLDLGDGDTRLSESTREELQSEILHLQKGI